MGGSEVLEVLDRVGGLEGKMMVVLEGKVGVLEGKVGVLEDMVGVLEDMGLLVEGNGALVVLGIDLVEGDNGRLVAHDRVGVLEGEEGEEQRLGDMLEVLVYSVLVLDEHLECMEEDEVRGVAMDNKLLEVGVRVVQISVDYQVCSRLV